MMKIFCSVLAGLFFLIGAIIAFQFKKNKKIIDFSVGMAFSVMLILLSFELIPETFSLLPKNKHYFIYIFIFCGATLLKLIDLLIPHHSHELEKKHHENHLKHIGLMSTIAIIIHNIIEGIGIYNLSQLDVKIGLISALGVGLHNIPFGIEITTMLDETKKTKKELIINILLLSVSTLFGAIIMLLIGQISNFVLATLMSLTVGMILYILIFELLVEITESKNKNIVTKGLILGTILMLITIILGE